MMSIVERLPIEQYGLNPTATMEAWKQSVGRRAVQYLDKIADKNMQAIEMLEAEIPGMCAVLNSEFGIYNFGRYPAELLLNQYRVRHDATTPYGLVIFPSGEDRDTYFHQGAKFAALSNSLQTLTIPHFLRIYECGDKEKLKHILKQNHARYNNKRGNLVSFMILAGHGTEDELHIGNQKRVDGLYATTERNILFKADTTGSLASLIRETTKPEATIILYSCSAGVKNGLAESLMQASGRKVIGQTKDGVVSGIQVGENEGRLSLSITTYLDY